MDRSISIRIPYRWLKVTAAAAVLAVVLAPVAVAASHRFSDVPDSNVFHSDIAWLAENKVTLGCNPPANDRFCPSANVTRQQMAAFMRRLATGGAVDAGTVEGRTAADLTSDAFSVFHDTAVGIPDVAPETVLSLAGLPAGSYAVTAKIQLWNPHPSPGVATCQLVAGSDLDQIMATVGAISFVPATLTVVHTFPAVGNAELRCDDNGLDMEASWMKITAVGVDDVTNGAG